MTGTRPNLRFARTAGAILLVAATAFPAAAKPAPSQSASNPVVATAALPRIKNFGQIDQHYYRGAKPVGNDFANLAAIGVKTIVSLIRDDDEASERTMVEQAGMTYVQIPMTTRTAPSAEQLKQFLAVTRDQDSQPVYVHCVEGRHRTGVMTAVYRMIQDGWSADDAYREMKRYNFGSSFLHPEFKKFVFAFVPNLPRSAADSDVTTKPR